MISTFIHTQNGDPATARSQFTHIFLICTSKELNGNPEKSKSLAILQRCFRELIVVVLIKEKYDSNGNR